MEALLVEQQSTGNESEIVASESLERFVQVKNIDVNDEDVQHDGQVKSIVVTYEGVSCQHGRQDVKHDVDVFKLAQVENFVDVFDQGDHVPEIIPDSGLTKWASQQRLIIVVDEKSGGDVNSGTKITTDVDASKTIITITTAATMTRYCNGGAV